MNDWTSGYVADIGYTYGYYTELNPLRARLAFLKSGLVLPKQGVHCELGYGQGMSVNIHAAASGHAWHGTDFNPSQASFAQSLAEASGANMHLADEAFADFCHRSDLPDFDSIGLHGIWSWISDENRVVIVDFIRRKLKVGGVLYISYNTYPGFAAFAPIRHLMTEHADVFANEGQGVVNRVNGALEFTEKLLATSPIYTRVNPNVAERFKTIKEQKRHYLAHEYFNRDWHPMHFGTMADWLAPAKLSYACSANYIEHIDALNLTAEQQAFMKEITDPMFRETVRDFMVNQQFRKDYWVKGARKLDSVEHALAWRQERVLLVTHRTDIVLEVKGALGESVMSEAIYTPILDFLSDHKPRTIGQVEQGVVGAGLTFAQIIEAFTILAGAGHLVSSQNEAVFAKVRKSTDKLNTCLIEKARSHGEISYLASPVTGGGININRFQQLFLLALSQGKKQPAEWAQQTWQILALQGQKILKEGKALESAEENIAELTRQATAFAEKRLPILKALQIV